MHPSIDTERVVTLRGKRGWSQEELAQASGLSARTIQRLEAGAEASMETRKALAAAFDLSLEELVRSESRADNSRRGVRWGTAGATAGYASAFVAVTYSLAMGQISGSTAGITLGTLGAATGTMCAGIAWLGHRSRRVS